MWLARRVERAAPAAPDTTASTSTSCEAARGRRGLGRRRRRRLREERGERRDVERADRGRHERRAPARARRRRGGAGAVPPPRARPRRGLARHRVVREGAAPRRRRRAHAPRRLRVSDHREHRRLLGARRLGLGAAGRLPPLGAEEVREAPERIRHARSAEHLGKRRRRLRFDLRHASTRRRGAQHAARRAPCGGRLQHLVARKTLHAPGCSSRASQTSSSNAWSSLGPSAAHRMRLGTGWSRASPQ